MQLDLVVASLDSHIRFMTRPGYAAANPAVAVVRTPLVAGLWVMLALSFIILVWGALVPIESSAIAKGSVDLLSNKKTIQHLEGGIISEILVKDGDRVTAGQKLIRLNDTSTSASRDALQEQLFAARATEARLIAERDKQDAVTFDPDMIESGNANDGFAKVLATQTHLFESERDEQNAKLGVLNQRIAQAQDEITGLKAQADSATSQLGLLGNEIGSVQKLLKLGYATETRLMSLQRNQSELLGSQGQYEAQISKAQQNIEETEMTIVDQQKEFESKNLESLHDTDAQMAELKDKLRSMDDVVDRTVITSPTEGIVTGLQYHTPGGVIEPGRPIMDIIPQTDQLVVDVHVRPNDITAVHAGMQARIMFLSYKARTTPKIPGTVTQVSADIVTDEHNPQAAPYYLARVEVNRGFLKKMSKRIELYPGMPVVAMIRTGSRSFLSYLFKPIADSMQKAFREE